MAASGARRARSPRGRGALLAGLSAAVVACGPDPAPVAPAAGPPRLVVLYAPCTVTRAHLSPYRPDVAYTPQLAEFARRAVVFERHHTEAPSSGIAYASLFTGAQADRHGVFRHPSPVSEDAYGIFEAFADAGFATWSWSSHPMASPALGYARGVPPEHVFERWLLADDPDLTALLARLAREPGQRALVVASFTVTHGPYSEKHFGRFAAEHSAALARLGPDPTLTLSDLYRSNHFLLSWNLPLAKRELGLDADRLERLTREVELLYAANVAELDRRFGALLAAIDAHGLTDQSLVAFTADHGEVLADPTAVFQWSHSMQLAPQVLEVPWLLAGPGIAPGRYASVSRSIDVYPTLAGLAGVALPGDRGIQGVDLTRALRGEAPAPALEAWSHTTVLNASVARQMENRRHRSAWQRVRGFFGSDPEDPGVVWVALRRGDSFHRLRQLTPGTWSVTSQRLVEDPRLGRARPIERLEPDPGVAARLASYKQRLVRAFLANRQGGRRLPEAEQREALRALGYIR